MNAKTQYVAKPYMAAQSFGPADADLFFGRDGEGIALARFIEDRPLSVLTAPSGIGKTSLLNARVIPLLEKRRWITVATRPTEDPEESIRQSISKHLIPPLRDERAALAGLIASAPGGGRCSLSGAFDWHDGLGFQDRIRHRFFVPAPIKPYEAMPMISRALRGSISAEDLLEHYEAVASQESFLGLTEHMTLAALRKRLREAQVQASYQAWEGRFAACSDSLVEALRIIEADWLSLRPRVTGLLLIVDQFEEMFTVAGAEQAARWMAEFEKIVAHRFDEHLPYPIRLTISLRKEFLADLMPLLEPFGPAETITYFLGSLNKAQARDALSCPLERMGFRLVDMAGQGSTIDRIIDGLRERAPEPEPRAEPDDNPRERFSPILVSLLGAHLWKKLEEEDEPVRELDFGRFERLVPALENIFQAYLNEALSDLSIGEGLEVTQFDALELLDRLVTSGGFRNFVLEEQLISQMPIPRESAEKLLERLDYGHHLVRRERRGANTVFVEIMHEKLIGPVRSMLNDLRQQEQLRAALLAANGMLEMLRDEPDPEATDPLPAYFRSSLERYCHRLELDRLGAKTLLRSLLLAGPRQDRATWARALSFCAARLRRADEQPGARRILFRGRLLDEELNRVERRGFEAGPDERRLLTESALADLTDGAAERVRRAMALWTGKVAA